MADEGDHWKVTTHGTMFYTDDVAIFPATRRLTLDGVRPSRRWITD